MLVACRNQPCAPFGCFSLCKLIPLLLELLLLKDFSPAVLDVYLQHDSTHEDRGGRVEAGIRLDHES